VSLKLLPLVMKNVFRKKTRSLLTIGSILLPLFVICIMGTMLKTLETDPSGGRGMYRLIVRHKVSLANWIPEAYEAKIRQLPGVVEVVKANWFGGRYIDHSARNIFSRFSVGNPESLLKVFDEVTIVQGSEKEWLDDRTGAVVGAHLMKKYGWKVGQKVPLQGDIYPVKLEPTIRAVYEGPDTTGLYMHHKYIEEALPRVKGWVGWYWIKADSPESVERLTKQIDALFENSERPTRSETEKEFQNAFVSMLGNVKAFLTFLCAIIVVVILLIAANTMAMAARERVTEIAVLRTLGFAKPTILGMILAEAVVLSVFGAAFGVALYVALFPGFRNMVLNSPMGFYAAGMKLFPGVVAFAFGITVLVGLLAGLVPAVRSAQRSITDGLRTTG
jgi:putative ABC transport system permease protein